MNTRIKQTIPSLALIFLLIAGFSVNAQKLPQASEYNRALVQCSSLIGETVELIDEMNSRKGRKNGGFQSEESKTRGMQLLRRYGDARLAVESVMAKLKNLPEGEKGKKEMLDRCMGIWQIVNMSRDQMLKCFEKGMEKKEVAELKDKLEASRETLNDPKGKYQISK